MNYRVHKLPRLFKMKHEHALSIGRYFAYSYIYNFNLSPSMNRKVYVKNWSLTKDLQLFQWSRKEQEKNNNYVRGSNSSPISNRKPLTCKILLLVFTNKRRFNPKTENLNERKEHGENQIPSMRKILNLRVSVYEIKSYTWRGKLILKRKKRHPSEGKTMSTSINANKAQMNKSGKFKPSKPLIQIQQNNITWSDHLLNQINSNKYIYNMIISIP